MGRNTYFQFKHFTIHQENAAMKVGTDGVLLGAWVNIENASRILDIGTGTGLIALMLAQRSQATIDAIDIEADAVFDAKLNFKNSSWNDRLNAQQIALQEFAQINSSKYDCIVCNPPFFTNGVKSEKNKRKIARHNDSLSFKALAKATSLLMNKKGSFNVIIPAEAEQEFRYAANNYRLFASKIVRVKPKPSKPVKRVLIEFKFEYILEEEEELTLETETHHEYTNEAIKLLKEFYLKL